MYLVWLPPSPNSDVVLTHPQNPHQQWFAGFLLPKRSGRILLSNDSTFDGITSSTNFIPSKRLSPRSIRSHAIANTTEAAYVCTTYLKERHDIMQHFDAIQAGEKALRLIVSSIASAPKTNVIRLWPAP